MDEKELKKLKVRLNKRRLRPGPCISCRETRETERKRARQSAAGAVSEVESDGGKIGGLIAETLPHR